jgi:GPH family glycoside/pentoside/hexuronide:cation symporter
MADASRKLTRKEVVGFGLGDFGFNLFWSTTSLYLLLFYTDVLGIAASTAGLIIFVCLVWDGVTDPVMGALASRTRSRWGRYRPYVLLGAPFTALSFWLMFTRSPFGDNSQVIWALLTHLLFRTAYTIQSIPYSSMSAVMTTDSTERGRLAASRMVAATVSGLLVAFFTLALAGRLAEDRAAGFAYVAALYAILSLALFTTTFLTTREHVAPSSSASVPGYKDLVRLVTGNPAFLLLFGATIMSSIGGTLFSKTLVYHVIYDLGSPDSVGLLLATLIGTITLFVPLWQVVTGRTSKRFVWLCGCVISIMVYAMWFLVPPDTVRAAMFFLVLAGVGSAAFYLTFWSMLPDTIEYGLFRTGVRAESLQFGLMSFSQKVALGVGVGLLGVLLEMIGYRANVPQADDTLAGITFIMTILPATFALLSATLMWFYPLDTKLHGRLARAIDRRERRSGPAALWSKESAK